MHGSCIRNIFLKIFKNYTNPILGVVRVRYDDITDNIRNVGDHRDDVKDQIKGPQLHDIRY